MEDLDLNGYTPLTRMLMFTHFSPYLWVPFPENTIAVSDIKGVARAALPGGSVRASLEEVLSMNLHNFTNTWPHLTPLGTLWELSVSAYLNIQGGDLDSDHRDWNSKSIFQVHWANGPNHPELYM